MKMKIYKLFNFEAANSVGIVPVSWFEEKSLFYYQKLNIFINKMK